MPTCEYRRCQTQLPLDGDPRRRFCSATHRAGEHRLRRRDALRLFAEAAQLRRTGGTDPAVLDDLDRRATLLAGAAV